VLGVREEERLPPIKLEVNKEHLKVRGAHEIRDVATGESDTK
jgi:hypothetical protein